MAAERPILTPEDEKNSIRTFLTALEPFRAANPTMPLQQVVTYCLVALDEGKPVSTYAQRAGMAQGVMTRNLLDLGEYDRNRKPGLMLLEQRPNLEDRRERLNYLTHKGRALLGAVHRAMMMGARK